MSRRLAIGLVALLALTMLGTGGWSLRRVQARLRQTAQQLLDTQGSLAQSQESVTMLEQEHAQLSKSYDTLKSHLVEATRQLKEATQQSATMSAESDQLTRTRTDLERRLDTAQREERLLKEETKALYKEIADTEAGKAVLELKLTDELERSRQAQAQAKRRVEEQQAQEERLRQQLAELSRAYEQVAKTQQVAANALPAESVEATREQTPVKAPTEVIRPHTPDRNELAQRYREAGDHHLANQSYRKAAAAFERSLAFEDDPTVHTKLEFLYTRLVPDLQRARRHATLASADRHPFSGLSGTSGAQGLPRSGRRLLWDWLSGK